MSDLLIGDFITIWNNYYSELSVRMDNFEKYNAIIEKVKQKSKLVIKDKVLLIELIEGVSDIIYTINNYINKYKIDYVRPTKKYDEPELICCTTLQLILECELDNELEDIYDDAISKSWEN